MKFIGFLNRTISFSFYLLFFFVPLVFAGNTSELFEFNKMWLTYGLTIIIVLAWISKMILGKRFFFQRTPLDIPIGLFLLSQTISTIFSLDRYVSFWGYYSRFNGGFVSITSYILLYYAFVSNMGKKQVMRLLSVSLFSGLVVALWGLPSHFGYDPTCFVFRGNFDVSCWTDAFQPKVRIFSTLGQPDWMAAYMAVLVPLAIAFGIKENQELRIKNQGNRKHFFFVLGYLSLAALFYIDLLFTRSRSGFLAIAAALAIFFSYYFLKNRKQPKKALALASCFVILILGISFFVGTSVAQIDRFTFSGIQSFLATKQQQQQHATTIKAQAQKPAPTPVPPLVGELGGTDSGKIRLFVWEGALKAWESHPLFGTGVETFAFAYYQFRPAGHNLTSEWDYLYNKAHNEFLNYLATTGIFGLGSYLAIIAVFLFVAYKKLPRYRPELYKSQESMLAAKQLIGWYQVLLVALVSSFVSILITNFFGFSVVIINLYLFFIPVFVFSIENVLKKEKVFALPQATTSTMSQSMDAQRTTPWQLFLLSVCTLLAIFFLISLFRSWMADTEYAYGYNLDHAGYYQQAHAFLQQAVDTRSNEPVFLDELSINDAVLATTYAEKDATTASQLAQEAIRLSDQVTTEHPNNVVYWKTRVRLFYSIGQFNQKLMPYALDAIKKAHTLAPTDAKISYNLGLLYSQNDDLKDGIAIMQQTIALKPDYRDAYYALGLFYRQIAIDKDGTVVDTDSEQKAVATMHFILTNLGPDQAVEDALKNWGEQ